MFAYLNALAALFIAGEVSGAINVQRFNRVNNAGQFPRGGMLAGALLYILNTGNAVAGAPVLFAMGREMGAPLLLISTQPEANQKLVQKCFSDAGDA